LHAGLNAGKAPRRARRYRLKPASLGQPLPGIDLDKALQLADALESLVLTAKRREWRMQSEEPLPVVLDAILRMLAHRQRRLS